MKTASIFIRIVCVLLMLVHLYNMFFKEEAPKWSYGLFALALLLLALTSFLQKKSKSL